jgi:sigma-B regulation protein RsbU (phosphoserine phosphatase)
MFDRMSARALRIMFSVLGLLVVAICTHNFLNTVVFYPTSNDECFWSDIPSDTTGILITNVAKGGVTDQAGVKDGDHLLRINGQRFKNSGIAQSILNRVPAGGIATYLIERNGKQFETQIHIFKVFEAQNLSLFLLGFGFLLVGYIVVLTKPHGKVQRLCGWFGLMAMLTFGLFSSQNGSDTARWIVICYTVGIVIGRAIAPAIFIQFFLHFPVRHKLLDRRWFVPCLYAFSITSLVVLYFLQKSPPTPLFYFLAYAPISFFIAGLFFFIGGYFRVDPSKRRQLSPILITAAIDVVAFTYGLTLVVTNPLIFIFHPLAVLPMLSVVGLPVAFGYSIFRYRLMDIDLIVKRSLIYATVTATIAATYLVVVFGIGRLIGSMFGHAESQALNVIAFVIIALIFDPVKRRTQEWIDKIFYRERLNYQKALLEFSQELPRQMNLNEILHSIINRISTTMHVERIGVVICDGEKGCTTVSRNIPAAAGEFTDEPGGLIDLMRRKKTPQSFALLDEESESIEIHETDKKRIRESGIMLSVPMMLNERLVGTINVGEKLSGKVYSQEDIDLLSTVAGQAAIAIENARLHQSEIEKQRMEEELDIARRIQQGLLPKCNPSIKNLDICGISIPALSVGGDYYDFIQLADGKLLVVVADVSGKGMSAALYMSKIQGMLQLAAHMYKSPKEMLNEVNRRIYDGIERKSFITMVLGLFDPAKNEVIICRAGHNKPLIGYNGDLRFAEGTGIGLGLEPGPIFEHELEEVRQTLEPGRVFVFYSDGLTEAMNEQKEQFGDATVYDLVKKHKDMTSSDLLDSILAGVRAFRGAAEPHDDLTLVVVKTR